MDVNSRIKMIEKEFDDLFKYQVLRWHDIKKSDTVTHKIIVDWRFSQKHKPPRNYKGCGYFSLWCIFLETDKSVNPYAEINKPCYFLSPALAFSKGLNKFQPNLASCNGKVEYTFKKLSQQTMPISEIFPVEREIKPPPHLYDPDRMKRILGSNEFQILQREYANELKTNKDKV